MIERLYSKGCVVVSITFDGAQANVKMFETFGGSANPNDIRCSFPHPCDSSMEMYGCCDPPHMLKLVRNMLQAYQQISIPNVEAAKWLHVVDLYYAQKSSRFPTLTS